MAFETPIQQATVLVQGVGWSGRANWLAKHPMLPLLSLHTVCMYSAAVPAAAAAAAVTAAARNGGRKEEGTNPRRLFFVFLFVCNLRVLCA